MKIIEFLGMPGIGKTTVCNALIDLLRKDGYIVLGSSDLKAWQESLKYHEMLKFKLLGLSYAIVRFPLVYRAFLNDRSCKQALFRRWVRHCIRPLYLKRFLANKKVDYLMLDQYEAQMAWSFFSFNPCYTKVQISKFLFPSSLASGLVIFAVLDTPQAAYRLSRRNHGGSRFEYDDATRAYKELDARDPLIQDVKDVMKDSGAGILEADFSLAAGVNAAIIRNVLLGLCPPGAEEGGSGSKEFSGFQLRLNGPD